MKQLTYIILMSFISISTVTGQIPQELSYQGLLTDANGKSLNGNYNLTFKFYTTLEGSSSIWEENQDVPVSDGIFNVILGNVNPLDIPFDKVYWMGISIGNDSELKPRVQLISSPYSLFASAVADSSISTIKLLNGAVTKAKLGNGSVSTEKIADGSVTGSKLSDNSLQAGSNVTISRQSSGALRIDAGGGNGGGLSSVATDATLAGDGTSGNPLSLANSAVTGSKLADDALLAGPNVRLTRQQDGAIEVASAGLGLPYTGSTNTSEAAFSIENTGNGDGIDVASGNYGIRVTQAGTFGLRINQATIDGVTIDQAGRFGLNISNSQRGVNINTTSSDGLLVGNSGRHGLYVLKAAQDGVVVQQAGSASTTAAADNRNNGVEVQGAESDGVFVGRADLIGLNIQSTGSNGIQVGTTGFDGLQIQSAGRDGVRVSSATDYGINAAGTKGAGHFIGDVSVTGNLVTEGDLTAKNIAINSVSYAATKLSVKGNAAVSGRLLVTSGAPSAGLATNIIQVDQNSATDPIADAWTVYSSRRWKTNIQTIDNAVEKVKRLRGVTYDWKADGKHDIGLIAEEVGEVFPEIVAYESNGVDAKSVDYARLVSVLIEAVKEQQTQIDELNARLNALSMASH